MGPDSQAHTCTLQSDPSMIKAIVDAVTIPVMAKVRIGHFVEAQVGLSFPHDQSFSRFWQKGIIDPPIYRYWLYRRIWSSHSCWWRISYQQTFIQSSVCLWRAQSWRGAAPYLRGCSLHPDERWGRNREHSRGRTSRKGREQRDPKGQCDEWGRAICFCERYTSPFPSCEGDGEAKAIAGS